SGPISASAVFSDKHFAHTARFGKKYSPQSLQTVACSLGGSAGSSGTVKYPSFNGRLARAVSDTSPPGLPGECTGWYTRGIRGGKRSFPVRAHLMAFVGRLRRAGVRISVAETLDAMAAVQAAGVARDTLRE